MPSPQDENGPTTRSGTKVPRRLGGFELIEKIGQGGMGSVFKARQVDLDRVVALKLLSPRLARNDQFVVQFMREARSAGRLNHPNIVAAIDVGENDGFYYFVMEYVDGETLAQLLKREGPLPEDRAIAIAIEVAKALDAAHQRGLVHRDIKPQNIMLTRDGRVRVTDFGLAKTVDPDGRATSETSRFLGTPAYMAPEQVRAEPDIDCRADIFSLGVMLFEILTGERAFTGANTVAIAAAVIAEPLPSIRKLRPDASLALCRVVEKMTAKKREDRYATPAAVVAALEAAASAPRIRPRPAAVARRPSARRRKSSPAALIGAVVVIAALVILAIVLASRASKAPPQQPRVEPPPAAAPDTALAATPTVPTVTKPGQRLFERLQSALGQAKSYAQQHPTAYVSQIRRYRKILDDFPPDQQVYLPREGLDLIKEAAVEVKRIRGEARQAAGAELAERDERAAALLKAGKVRQAMRLFDTFPAELQSDGAAAQLAASRRALYDEIDKLYGALDTRAKALVKESKFDEAKALYATVKTWKIRLLSERADVAIANINDLITAQGAERARQARRAFPKHARAVLKLLAARRYDEAEQALAAALVAPELKAVSAKFRDLQTITRAVKDVLAHAAIGAKKFKPGERVRVGGVAGQFVRYHDGKIFVKAYEKSEAAIVAHSLIELPARELVTLALSGYGDGKPQAAAPVGLFLLAEGDAAAARRGLEAAKAKGQDVDAALDLARRFGRRHCPTCKGEKTLSCPDCGGKGHLEGEKIECDACQGKGSVSCPRCNGRGWTTCRFCKGTGQVFRGLRCANCNGTGRLKCRACRGKGRVRCSKCKAAGTIVKTTPCPRCEGRKTIACPTCGGKGELPPLELVSPPPTTPKPAAATDGDAPSSQETPERRESFGKPSKRPRPGQRPGRRPDRRRGPGR